MRSAYLLHSGLSPLYFAICSTLAAEPVKLETLDVVGVTPLESSAQALEYIPSNSQSLDTDAIETQKPQEVSESLQRNLPNIHVSAVQSNPYQNDLNYRGLTASPLLGSQIGLSVYLDGVRINELFGDTLNWDLIPQAALQNMGVVAGSNPLYGLNTLGGAVTLNSKDGRNYQGTQLELNGGSFGRRGLELQHGGKQGEWDWYVAANKTREDGWRQHSPSDLLQTFGKLGWEKGDSRLSVSYLHADNQLTGNGVSPSSLVAQDRSATYTYPDETNNRLNFISLQGKHRASDSLSFAGNVYFRDYQRNTLNSDVQLECQDESGESLTLENGNDPHPNLCRNRDRALLQTATGGAPNDDPRLVAEAEDRRTHTRSRSYGSTLEMTGKGKLAGLANQFTLGANFEAGKTNFNIDTRHAELVPAGLSYFTEPEGDFSTTTAVRVKQQNLGLYATNTLSLTPQWHWTFSGRFQQSHLDLSDSTGLDTKLNGNHRFQRFNPALGMTYQVAKNLSVFANYSEGFRAPTAAELTCADPTAPCSLPNSFVADPPLNPVIAKTYEIGTRGTLPLGDNTRWSAALYRTNLSDDILFTQSGVGSRGFFQNVDKTQRQGVEMSVQGRWKKLRWFANYAYNQATFQTETNLASALNAAGTTVHKGDVLPNQPAHILKLGAQYVFNTQWSFGGNVQAVSSQFMRGDESNQLQKLAGYAVLNLNTNYQITKNIGIFAKLDNVLNTDYATSGVYNRNAFAALGEGVGKVESFISPAAPRSGWLGVRINF